MDDDEFREQQTYLLEAHDRGDTISHIGGCRKIPDVKAIRKHAGMKRVEFAEVMGARVDLVRSREQQRCIPPGIALKMPCLIERESVLINTLRGIHV